LHQEASPFSPPLSVCFFFFLSCFPLGAAFCLFLPEWIRVGVQLPFLFAAFPRSDEIPIGYADLLSSPLMDNSPFLGLVIFPLMELNNKSLLRAPFSGRDPGLFPSLQPSKFLSFFSDNIRLVEVLYFFFRSLN